MRTTIVWLAMFGCVLSAGCQDQEAEREDIPLHQAAATVPTGFSDETWISGLSSPTAMAFAPDGRLFVCEQGGALRVVKNGVLSSTPFLRVTVNASGERGLLGVTFDPRFESNGFVYVYYTASSPTVHNRVSRFTAAGDVALSGSEVVLLDMPTLSATNHNGGAMHFGADGKLYVAVGENAVPDHSQRRTNPFGKILRMNADGTVPSDNPFLASATGQGRYIWTLGLRNPFTFAMQPGTGSMYINDVGAGSWEEINVGAAGVNFGWPTTEGPTNDARFRGPLFSYGHGSGDTRGCAITGGVFYNPPAVQFPASYVGKYFFADYCNGWIRVLDTATATASAFATGISAPTDLRVGADGLLYYLARGQGAVGRIRAAGAQTPSISSPPRSQTRAVGQAVTFNVAAAGSAPLGYRWQRDGLDIPGATSASYTIDPVALADDGARFRVIVSNAFGSVVSAEAVLTVFDNQVPTAVIQAPALYSGGETITYSGAAHDGEDGALPASSFTWEVVFHHDDHTHPFVPETTGTSGGTFVVPTTGETATNVWYRVRLTVRDSVGVTTTVSHDVHPRVATLTLATEPPGLQVTLDGQPFTTPLVVPSVVGMVRSLGAPSPQTSPGGTFLLGGWSDGGAPTHDVSTPTVDTQYVAQFTPVSTGLTAEYFVGMTPTGSPRLRRVDPQVDFSWGTGAPDPSLPPDGFSVRWTGRIVPLYDELYTFFTTSDDGVRLWIDGALIVNNWTNHAATENSGVTPYPLVAGRPHVIIMETYEDRGQAVARLAWSSARQAKQVVPTTQLLPTGAGITRVNFQTATSVTPEGYVADTGNVFGERQADLVFGWNSDHRDLVRDREAHADQRLDTLAHFHAGGVWEMAVSNGDYDVVVSVGDPSFSSTYALFAENVTMLAPVALGTGQFRTLTSTVTVRDGRLTLGQGSAAEKATRINYVEITPR